MASETNAGADQGHRPIPVERGSLSGLGIVCVGSLYATERGGASSAAGHVADATRLAVLSGATGVAVSRVGMDRFGRETTDKLGSLGADIRAIQTDSDLVTPRCIERGTMVRIEPYGAFDNIQWDADLEALARAAEVIVTDAFGRRHGQSRSTIDRMMIAAPSAVRAIDLTRRPPRDASSGEARLDREQVGQALELCDLFIVDAIALRTLVPAASDPTDAARRFFDQRRRGSITLAPTDRDEGCVISLRGCERTPRLVTSGDARMDGTRVALTVAVATVLGRAPHELLAALGTS